MSSSAALPIWIQTLQALLTPVIGGLACWIAYQQYRTNYFKLRHDLFDRRLAVYDALRNFFAKVLREGKTSHGDCIELIRETSQAEFLFGPEIHAYIELIYSRGIHLKSLGDQLHSDDRLPVGPNRSRVAHEESQLLTWFTDQFSVARDHFRRYLRLESPSALQDLLKKYREKRKPG